MENHEFTKKNSSLGKYNDIQKGDEENEIFITKNLLNLRKPKKEAHQVKFFINKKFYYSKKKKKIISKKSLPKILLLMKEGGQKMNMKNFLKELHSMVQNGKRLKL